jgi:hypothetical protein
MIEHQVLDDRISWRVVNGPKYDGTVTFTELVGGRTQVSLRLEYESPGALDPAGAAAATGVVSGRLIGDPASLQAVRRARRDSAHRKLITSFGTQWIGSGRHKTRDQLCACSWRWLVLLSTDPPAGPRCG